MSRTVVNDGAILAAGRYGARDLGETAASYTCLSDGRSAQTAGLIDGRCDGRALSPAGPHE